jgi:5-methylcytosine-specific restriction endonuclease McrA
VKACQTCGAGVASRWHRYCSDKCQRAAAKARARSRIEANPDLHFAAIVRRDPCSYCGGEGGAADHIEPWARGGQDAWENYGGACNRCNAHKGARWTILETLRWARS